MVKYRKRTSAGLTLVEVMIASAILVFCLSAVLACYVNVFILGDLSRDFTKAVNVVSAKMEEIKKTNFAGVVNSTFVLDGFTAATSRGVIQIRNITGYTNLKEVRIVACFMSRNRVIGEDADFNGVLAGSEDINGNSRLDSPVELITLITQ